MKGKEQGQHRAGRLQVRPQPPQQEVQAERQPPEPHRQVREGQPRDQELAALDRPRLRRQLQGQLAGAGAGGTTTAWWRTGSRSSATRRGSRGRWTPEGSGRRCTPSVILGKVVAHALEANDVQPGVALGVQRRVHDDARLPDGELRGAEEIPADAHERTDQLRDEALPFGGRHPGDKREAPPGVQQGPGHEPHPHPQGR